MQESPLLDDSSTGKVGLQSKQMDQPPKRRIWLPSPGHLAAMTFLLLLGVLAIPGFQAGLRASNEREASTMLKTFTSAEADFRANDRDLNQVADFWTGDVSGLYYVKPAGGGREVRLIDADAANADARPIFPLPPGAGTRKGYRFQALDQDDSVDGDKAVYRVDTDKSGRKVHNLGMFGFIAFTEGGVKGTYKFIVNENNTIFRWRKSAMRTTWPSDEELKKFSCEDED